MSSRVLRVIAGFTLVTTVGEGIMGTLFAPFVHDAVHADASVYGLIVSAQAVGGIIGGLVAAAAGDRFRPERLFGWGAAWFGAVDLVLFLYPLAYPVAWPAVVCMLVVGIPGAFSRAGSTTLVQRATQDSHRGRLFGALGTLQAFAVVVGLVCAGFLGEAVGVIPILAIQGAGYLLAGLVVLAVLRPPARELPGPAIVEADAGSLT